MSLSIENLIRRLRDVTHEEKSAKSEKEGLRAQLFDYVEQDYEGKEHLLPTTTITVPDEFWARTGLREEAFLYRSFPTWEIQSKEHDATKLETTYILRKSPYYMPFKWEDDEVKLSKTTTDPTPDIDLDTLKADRPDLFEKITTTKVVHEIEAEKLLGALEDDPEIQNVLMRHTVYTREPQQRVGIKDV